MFLKMETTSKKIMQPTIKSKDNGCGTAPGIQYLITCCNWLHAVTDCMQLQIEPITDCLQQLVTYSSELYAVSDCCQ